MRDMTMKPIVAKLHLNKLRENALPPPFFQWTSQIIKPSDMRNGAANAANMPDVSDASPFILCDVSAPLLFHCHHLNVCDFPPPPIQKASNKQ
mmetsp:Transcript_21191/g.38247  ORF Transcript_21191/g.38247 Transcript_21191/m.38247 type:complete len:93 (-) Transcript_21191:92-370(-)